MACSCAFPLVALKWAVQLSLCLASVLPLAFCCVEAFLILNSSSTLGIRDSLMLCGILKMPFGVLNFALLRSLHALHAEVLKWPQEEESSSPFPPPLPYILNK